MNENKIEYDSNLYNYQGWRSVMWPPILRNLPKRIFKDTDVYFFGVFGGKSVIQWCNMFKDLDMHPHNIVCFDSFEGVPLETAEEPMDDWNPNTSTFFSAFNAKEYFETSTVDESVELFYDRVEPCLPSGTQLKIVPGFFEHSLTTDLALELNRPSIVDIDVDIYSSTKETLSWLFENNLMIKGTTMIGYDDWGGTPGYRDRLDGESRAHREIEEQYDLTWHPLACTYDTQQIIFRLEK